MDHAVRGEILVVVIDNAGQMIWISEVFRCPTRCGTSDLFCASSGRVSFVEQLPEAIARNAERLDIMQGDDPSFADARVKIIEVIKSATDIALEVKEALKTLKS